MRRSQGGVALVSVLLVVGCRHPRWPTRWCGPPRIHDRAQPADARRIPSTPFRPGRRAIRTPDPSTRIGSRRTPREIDTLLEEWSAPAEAFEVRGGALEIRIQDLERRFNLNAVAGDREGAQDTARLKRLLTALEIDANLADRWVDWVDAEPGR